MIERAALPEVLEVTAWTDDGEIMGVRHQSLPVEGVQFHPESILTEHGHELLRNFLPGAALSASARRGGGMTPQDALVRVIEHREIFHEEMLSLMRQIMSGEVSPTLIAAIIIGLRVKKETIGEIAAAAQVMREFATKVEVPDHAHLLDTCGTGGDSAHTFNISTAAAFVAAAAGAKVAKHGNRSVSSKSGSADVLEALGVNIDADAGAGRALHQRGRRRLHVRPQPPPGAMKHAAPVRRELGVRTIFNILGPLTNPAGARNQVMGVFHPDLVGIQARVLQRLGSRHVMVVYGLEGLDEISIAGETMVGELKDGEVREYTIHPRSSALPSADLSAIRVPSAPQSRDLLLAALDRPSRVRRATSWRSTPARRSTSRAWPIRSSWASSKALRRASPAALRAASSTSWSQFTNASKDCSCDLRARSRTSWNGFSRSSARRSQRRARAKPLEAVAP